MKDCIISYASKGREDYNSGLLKLIDSCAGKWDGDLLMYSPDHELNDYNGIKIIHDIPATCMSHLEMPYQFKYGLIFNAIKLGYERIIWLDSTMKLAKNPTPLFGKAGITTFHNLGHDLYKYISDDAVSLLKIEEDKLKEISQIWGGALFFDFTKTTTAILFWDIYYFSVNGSFKDGFSKRNGFISHRHDQAVLSVLTHNKCDLMPYGKIVSRAHAENLEYGNDFYLIYG